MTAALVLALSLFVAFGYNFALSFLSDSHDASSQQKQARAEPPAPSLAAKELPKAATARTPQDQSVADAGSVKFDVVRIDPDKASVFAGRAPADSTVTITANGQPVTTAKANADGEWAAVLEHKFAPGTYDLALAAKPKAGGPEMSGQREKIVIASPLIPPTQPRLIAPSKASLGASGKHVSVGPIAFVYDEAMFTPEGYRAAARLADYLRANRIQSVTLSGHADERGSERHNEGLSRRRAEAVAAYLKDRGFKGTLTLIAKGAAEPFSAIERRSLPLEEVYQFDRRVELRAAQ